MTVLGYNMSFEDYLGYKWDVLMRLNIVRSVLNIDKYFRVYLEC